MLILVPFIPLIQELRFCIKPVGIPVIVSHFDVNYGIGLSVP